MTAALWGGTPTAIRFSVEAFGPVTVAALRFALGAAFMVVWCRFEGTELTLRRGQRWPALLAGVLLFAQISLFNVGVALSNSSHGTLMINTFVIWVVLIEHFITRVDRLSLRRVLGLAIAAGGAMLILMSAETGDAATRSKEPPTLLGDLVLMASAVVLAVKIVYIKHALKRVEPGKLILWHDVFGVILFAAWAAAFETMPSLADVSTGAVLGVLYQGVLVAGLCFAVQTLLLRRHSASRISIFSFATPLFGITAAVLLRGDALSAWLLVSAACVAVGIMLVNSPSKE